MRAQMTVPAALKVASEPEDTGTRPEFSELRTGGKEQDAVLRKLVRKRFHFPRSISPTRRSFRAQRTTISNIK